MPTHDQILAHARHSASHAKPGKEPDTTVCQLHAQDEFDDLVAACVTEEAETLTYAGYPMLVLVMLVEAETVKAPAAPVVAGG